MKAKQIIKRVFFITLTLAACSGLIVLLVAAIGKKNHQRCEDYEITIKGVRNNFFISDQDILKLITQVTKGRIKNERIVDFNLRKLEQQIKSNPWVQKANLYFDNKDVLHVTVNEKEPVARVFTISGKSFYIDSAAVRMPLSDKMSARVPVFTNFPDRKYLGKKDSILLDDIKNTAWFILNDPFWMAQTEQIDITKDRTFEMIPTIGNHIIKLGNGENIEKKFHRLFIFYQQVMRKSGFNTYNAVDVQYDGQVIGVKEKTTKVDSLQVKKNIEKLLQEARQMRLDSGETLLPGLKQNNTLQQQPGGQRIALEKGITSNGGKKSKNEKSGAISQVTGEGKPKAVMPKKNEK